MTLQQLVQHFINHPSYLETGAPKLSKQFNVSLELVLEAKKQVRDILKTEIMKDLKQDSISLKEFGKMLGIDMDSDPDMDIPKNNTLTNAIVSNGPEQDPQWEEKVKWIKTGRESKLFVKKPETKECGDINIKEEFRNFLKMYIPKERLIEKPSFKYNSALLVYTSDKHIGAKTKDNALLDNEWNKEEFLKRMASLAKEIVRLNELYYFDSIIIMDLGDAIDGQDGYTQSRKHQLPQNMSNREVYSTFMEVHTDFFYTLSVNCTKSNLIFITAGESNHGGDMEWMCNKSLEAVLNLRFPEIQTYIGNKFIEDYVIGDHCFIVCHGKDAEDMKFPMPQVLDAKTELYFKKYIEHRQIDAKYIHIIKGDLHVASSQWGEFFRYKNVLSMYGSSKWIQTNFMSNTKGVSMDILSKGSVTEHQLFF